MIVQFQVRGERRAVDGADGESVAELATRAGFHLQMACAGHGVCGRCAVLLHEGEFRTPRETFTVRPGAPRHAQACQTRAFGLAAEIEIPAASLVETRGQIHDDFVLPPHEFHPRARRVTVGVPAATLADPAPDAERLAAALAESGVEGPIGFSFTAERALAGALDQEEGRVRATVGPFRGRADVTLVEPAGRKTPHLAVAADIGTTTVVCVLLDLDREGAVRARASNYNQQIRKADDVAARISYGRTGVMLRELQRLVVEETLNPLLAELCAAAGCAPAQIVRLALAGNTVMMHLLLGLPPGGIGVIPFRPVVRRYREYRARELGLAIHPDGIVELVPAMTGHVGGDLTADAAAARLLEREGTTLLVDIGTNGEILLWDGGRLRVTATAAGPAFEGAGLLHGCRAAEGAVEHFEWGPALEPRFNVIGGGLARGFCGSAIIDWVAESLRAGVLGANGRFDLARLHGHGRYAESPTPRGAMHACRVVPAEQSASGEPLLVTERDVAEVLKAKAAIYAGMKTILAAAGRTFADVDRLILAGGFARHIRLRSAVRMGLLPGLAPGRIEVIGNGSLAGACLALTEAGAGAAFERVVACAEPVELNLEPGFEDAYVDALLLPHADPDEFPAGRADRP